MGIPLAALAIHPQQNMLDQFSEVQGIQGQQQQQQLRAQAIQQGGIQTQLMQKDLDDRNIISTAYKKNNGDLDKTFNDAAQGGASPQSLMNLHLGILKQHEAEQGLLKTNIENIQNQNDAVLAAHDSVKALPEAQRPAAYVAGLQNLQKQGIDISKFPQQYDPNTFDTIGAGLNGTSARLTALARMQQAGKPPEGEMPLGDKVGQLNQALQTRYQITNPGQPLPPQFALPPNATQKDYDRVDKIMQATESAQQSKANTDQSRADRQQQQNLINSVREQTLELSKQSALDREQKQGIEPVVGQDANGRSVLASAADAKTMGLTGTMKADADLVNKATAARDWLKLADKQGDAPETMGITQLIDKMDKEGKLGTIASRWNEFMAGKVGAGDPEFAALRAKMGLSTTKLMQAHVGSRGGAFLLEHFEDLANAKKMDAPTLKAGIGSELDYMKDVAKLPGAPTSATGGGKMPTALTAEQVTAYANAHHVSEDEVKRQAKAKNIKVPD